MRSIFNSNVRVIQIIALLLIVIIVPLIIFIRGSKKKQSAFLMEGGNSIIPKPMHYERAEGKFIINKDTSIYVKGNNENETGEISRIAEYFKRKIENSTGFDLKILKGDAPSQGSIYLMTTGSTGDENSEGYKMSVSPECIKINGNRPQGIFRAIQTLRQLLPVDIEKDSLAANIEWSVPASIIEDKPEFEYRGMMIDVVRHFFSVDEIKRQIDLAALYKINKVHLHLSDDQGWRLEIKKWPDLTAIGGSTVVGGGPGGYYTQEEFMDIVKYAAERYIEIIPEFEMPGHSNAALASYGFLNEDGARKPMYTGIEVGFSSLMTHDEKTYEFIDDVIGEVSEISPSKYIHIGGDESDSTKKEDYDYFVGRVSRIVEKYGKTAIGWDPIDTSSEIGSNVILQNWRDSNKSAREKGMKMIISIAKKSYMDMKYNVNTPYGLTWAAYISIKDAYSWEPEDFAPRELILGVEAPLWAETILNGNIMDYMIYPRLLGYAEIGWTPSSSRNWGEYKARLKSQEQRMKNLGINFYNGK